jgi:phenylacetate-CoA ligase
LQEACKDLQQYVKSSMEKPGYQSLIYEENSMKQCFCGARAKKRNFIYTIALNLKDSLPSELFFGRQYFFIRKLLRMQEKGARSDLLDLVVRKRMAEVLKNALLYVPFYRDTVKVKADQINTKNVFDVLKSFPYLEKKTIMGNQKDFINRRFIKNGLFYATSGGSTGEGVGVWRTKQEREAKQAFLDHELSKFGSNIIGSKIAVCSSSARKKASELPCERRGRLLMVSPYHFNKQYIELVYNGLKKFRPDYIYIYPSCMYELAEFIVGMKKPVFECRGIIFMAEALLPGQYQLLRKAFKAPMRIFYSLTEGTNIAFSGEGQDIFKYALNPLYSFSENRIDDKQFFEIVGTSYWNLAMPLIRYCTQDYGRIEDGVINCLDGRKQDLLFAKNGGFIAGVSVKIDEFTWDYVYDYQIIQEVKGEIIIKVVPRRNFNSSVKGLILEKQRERWGSFFDIKLEVVDTLTRTSAGKKRLVVSLI